MSERKAGDKFNKLMLMRNLDGSVDRFYSTDRVVFLCDCGNEHIAILTNVVRGNTKHCKNCTALWKSKLHKSHGNSIARKDADPAGYNCYTRWQSMKRRCYKEYDSHYHRYGGRGIMVCDRWLNSYENFLADMGLPPDIGYQIDRIDNDKDYSPDNCRWVSRTDNARNKSNNKIIAAFGESLTQSEWAERTGIKRETIAMRLKRGWTPEMALTKNKC